MDAQSPTHHDRLTHHPAVAPGRSSPTGSTDGPTPLLVLAWCDDTSDGAPGGLATASDATLLYWTPILGPTGALLLHRLAALASAQRAATTTVEDLARL